jgi:hypothetical protein
MAGRVALTGAQWAGIRSRLRAIADAEASIKAFSRKLGVNDRAARKWLNTESGKGFDLARVFQVAAKFNKSPTWLLLGTGPEELGATRSLAQLSVEVSAHVRRQLPLDLREYAERDPREKYPDGNAILSSAVTETERQLRLALEWQSKGAGSVLAPLMNLRALYEDDGPLGALGKRSAEVRTAQGRMRYPALLAQFLVNAAPVTPFFPKGIHYEFSADPEALRTLDPISGVRVTRDTSIAALLDFITHAILLPAASLAEREMASRSSKAGLTGASKQKGQQRPRRGGARPAKSRGPAVRT